jgi:hypothetical protein
MLSSTPSHETPCIDSIADYGSDILPVANITSIRYIFIGLSSWFDRETSPTLFLRWQFVILHDCWAKADEREPG